MALRLQRLKGYGDPQARSVRHNKIHEWSPHDEDVVESTLQNLALVNPRRTLHSFGQSSSKINDVKSFLYSVTE